jgi:hypothetical protein
MGRTCNDCFNLKHKLLDVTEMSEKIFVVGCSKDILLNSVLVTIAPGEQFYYDTEQSDAFEWPEGFECSDVDDQEIFDEKSDVLE